MIKKFIKNELIFILLFLIFFIFIFLYFANTDVKTNTFQQDFEKKVNNYRIYDGISFFNHCTSTNEDDLCIKILKDQNNKKKIVWIGNSQLDMINNQQNNEITSPELLYADLQNNNIDLVSFSHPNISIKEKYLLLNFLLSHVKLDLVIIGLCFDDLREITIRNTFTKYIKDTKSLNNLLKTNSGIRIYENYKNSQIDKQNLTSKLDNFLINNYLNKINYLSFVDNVQGFLRVHFYSIRNYIFNIKPETIRKTSVSLYDENIKYYFEIINLLKKNNVKLFNYIVPIRNDFEIPYEKKKYSFFKNEIEKFSSENFIIFENIEDLIPSMFYGQKPGTAFNRKLEIDFMHFDFRGHLIMKNYFLKKINKIINDL